MKGRISPELARLLRNAADTRALMRRLLSGEPGPITTHDGRTLHISIGRPDADKVRADTDTREEER
jgi:hypothetical protein